MFLIVGLGNIGIKYDNTRHNIGFKFIDYLAAKENITVYDKKFDGIIGCGIINGKKVILAKPTTYMNLSGECIRKIMDFYKISNKDILIVYDDIALDIGKIRIRKKGSAGGHNGIKSIIANIGTEEFNRIRIGIGKKPDYMDLADYVLGKFSDNDIKVLDRVLKGTCNAAEQIIDGAIDDAMNKFNGISLTVD